MSSHRLIISERKKVVLGQTMRLLFRSYLVAKSRGMRCDAARLLRAHMVAARQLRHFISLQPLL
jgi:hypothetical protein